MSVKSLLAFSGSIEIRRAPVSVAVVLAALLCTGGKSVFAASDDQISLGFERSLPIASPADSVESEVPPTSVRIAAQVDPAATGEVIDLNKLVHWSLQNHPLIRSAIAQVDAAAADVAQSKWQFYPTPYLRADAYRGRGARVAGVRQPLWTGGRLSSDVQAAEAIENVAVWSLRQERREMAQRVARHWLAVMTAAEQRKVALEGHEELLRLRDMMDRRVKAQYSAPVDLSLVQARVLQSQSELNLLQAQLDTALYELQLLAGRSLLLEQFTWNEQSPVRSFVTLEEAKGVLVNEPLWKKAQADIAVARARHAQAEKQTMPTLEARVEYQAGEHALSARDGYRLSVGFEQSFGAGRSSSAAIEAARVKIDATAAQAEAIARDLLAQFLSDQSSLNSAIDRIESMHFGLKELDLVASSYRRAFDAGRRSWLELLNTVRENTQSRQQLVRAQAEARYHAYRLNLYLRGVE